MTSKHNELNIQKRIKVKLRQLSKLNASPKSYTLVSSYPYHNASVPLIITIIIILIQSKIQFKVYFNWIIMVILIKSTVKHRLLHFIAFKWTKIVYQKQKTWIKTVAFGHFLFNFVRLRNFFPSFFLFTNFYSCNSLDDDE